MAESETAPVIRVNNQIAIHILAVVRTKHYVDDMKIQKNHNII